MGVNNAAAIPALPCTCATLRRATRALTLLYDEALRPTGLRSTQFTILQALSLAGPVNQKQLGHILAIDSTSLTRALEPILRQGWIERHRGEDRRQWSFTLSGPGKALFRRALPRWNRLQTRLQHQLGSELWSRITQTANDLTSNLLQGETP
ncbi:MarR family winged helix-turn-helix transcriptional regulator [Edaphobacter aggregans]|uniref:MarR family winged helix-turn-helix transcriptional regulator n=1 Tax=Edaphobacter aggregans TaxID=570835 RepID=UPI0007E8C1EF|nr:MarR family winged helix-turn-helix transcriptional regulator [Edaphobacter aggregans]